MSMYSLASYRLTKAEYHYLLPAMGRKKLGNHHLGDYCFCGDHDELSDMLDRLAGLYGREGEDITSMIRYQCGKVGSLTPFRNAMPPLAD